MDFTRTEAAQDLSGLVSTIVDAVCTPQHQRELDRLDQRIDKTLWAKLIDADVLSAAAPESAGGGGYQEEAPPLPQVLLGVVALLVVCALVRR